jgi:hypothetical protein
MKFVIFLDVGAQARAVKREITVLECMFAGDQRRANVDSLPGDFLCAA